MRCTIARLAFWAACAFAFVMAVIPHPPGPRLPDKAVHAFAFLVLAILGHVAYPEVKKRWLFLGLAAFGALIELVQGLPFVGRDRDVLDWVADTVAAFAVFAVVALWSYWRHRRERG